MKLNRKKLSELTLNITDGEHGSVIDDPEGSFYLLSNKNIVDGEIVYSDEDRKISEGSFKKINRRTKLAQNDVVIATVGSIGRSAIIRDDNIRYDFQRSVGIIKCRNDLLNPEYLYYYLCQPYIQNKLRFLSKGAVQKCLFIGDLNNLDIDIPEDYEKQKDVTGILLDIDSKIRLNAQIDRSLEELATIIYEYWFLQFNFPDKNGLPYKASGGEMLWNEIIKREIPKEWQVQKLDMIADIKTGKLDSNAEKIDGIYPFYTCAANPSRTNTYSFDVEAILVAGNNAAGNFHVNRYKGRFEAYQRTYVITAKAPNYLDYIYQVLKRETKLFKKRGKGSQTKFLTMGMLTGISTFYGNDDVVNKYHEITSLLYTQQETVRKESRRLTKLKELLLPMLMNGQVRVAQ